MYISETAGTSSSSEFKKVFKFYKGRNNQFDPSSLIDPLECSTSQNIICTPMQESYLNKTIKKNLKPNIPGLTPIHEWILCTFTHRPGLFIIGGMLTRREQLYWIERSIMNYAEPPNVTNLSVQNKNPYNGNNVFRTCGEKIRWVTMGNDYNWETKEYAPYARNRLPIEMENLAKFVVNVLGLGHFEPDSAIINFYPQKSSLSPHVDRSERDLTKPLVSFSFGQPAVYLTGGCSLDDPIDAILLRSGNILVMSGPQRLVYHAVPRILTGQSFDDVACELANSKNGIGKIIAKDVVDYANRCRVNITIRQVAIEDE